MLKRTIPEMVEVAFAAMALNPKQVLRENDVRDETIGAATALTQEALALLDRVGAFGPACYLQQAIDLMTDAPIPKTPAEVEAAFETPQCQALLRRLGLQ